MLQLLEDRLNIGGAWRQRPVAHHARARSLVRCKRRQFLGVDGGDRVTNVENTRARSSRLSWRQWRRRRQRWRRQALIRAAHAHRRAEARSCARCRQTCASGRDLMRERRPPIAYMPPPPTGADFAKAAGETRRDKCAFSRATRRRRQSEPPLPRPPVNTRTVHDDRGGDNSKEKRAKKCARCEPQ